MTQEERKREMNRMQLQKDSAKSHLPPWMQAEKVSMGERFEIFMYRFVSIFPVFVTFGLYSYLGVFYIGVTTYSLNSVVLLMATDRWKL
jgi:hypothetical protein